MNNKIKKRGVFDYFSFKQLKSNIENFGYSYSLREYLKKLLLFLLIICVGCQFFSLKWICVLLICLTLILLMPGLTIQKFKEQYEKQDFNNLMVYIEQMMNAFKKRPKILSALVSTEKMLNGEIKEYVQEAIAYISEGYAKKEGCLYQEAFAIIESHYNSERLKSMHKFFVTIENTGGEYQSTLNNLISNMSTYKQRTCSFQLEKEKSISNFKFTMVFFIVLYYFIIKISGNIGGLIDLTSSPLYQITTMLIFIVYEIVYYITLKKNNVSWLLTDQITQDKAIINMYNDYMSPKTRRNSPISVILWVVSCIVIVISFVIGNIYVSIAGILLMAISMAKINIFAQSNKAYLEKEFKKVFPSWLRNLSVNLQRQNVAVAILESYDSAPEILKPEIKKLLDGIEKKPSSMEPFDNFLSNFDLIEIHSAMKMLYSLNEYGKSDVQSQIGSLVELNEELLDKAERLKNEEIISGTKILVRIPEVLISVKITFDMFIIMAMLFAIDFTNI